MKHSPAPWRISREPFAYDPEGFTRNIVVDKDGFHVALPFCIKNSDAALITAAPELLEACKNALSYMNVYNSVSPTISEYEMNIANSIRSAIAKAEGHVPTQTETHGNV